LIILYSASLALNESHHTTLSNLTSSQRFAVKLSVALIANGYRSKSHRASWKGVQYMKIIEEMEKLKRKERALRIFE
jgi:hypothetical protein